MERKASREAQQEVLIASLNRTGLVCKWVLFSILVNTSFSYFLLIKAHVKPSFSQDNELLTRPGFEA